MRPFRNKHVDDLVLNCLDAGFDSPPSPPILIILMRILGDVMEWYHDRLSIYLSGFNSRHLRLGSL